MYPISPMRPKAVQQAVLLPSTRRLALKSTLARNAPIHLSRGWVILTGTTFCGSHQGFKPIFKLIISLIYRSATFLLLRLLLLDPYITGAGQTGAAELLPRQNPRVLECRGTCKTKFFHANHSRASLDCSFSRCANDRAKTCAIQFGLVVPCTKCLSTQKLLLSTCYLLNSEWKYT
jgi:hypothetical protein